MSEGSIVRGAYEKRHSFRECKLLLTTRNVHFSHMELNLKWCLGSQVDTRCVPPHIFDSHDYLDVEGGSGMEIVKRPLLYFCILLQLQITPTFLPWRSI